MVPPILVFQNNDGPAPNIPTDFDEGTLTLRVVAPGCSNPPMWQGMRQLATSAAAILAKETAAKETGAKVSKRADVVFLVRVFRPCSSADTLNASDEVVAGLDFRTSAGRKMDNQRREYGQTYSRAPAKPTAVNAEEMYVKKAEKIRRNRERVNEEIDGVDGNVDVDVAPQPKKSARTETKSVAAAAPAPKPARKKKA
jgi:hypothetical protein